VVGKSGEHKAGRGRCRSGSEGVCLAPALASVAHAIGVSSTRIQVAQGNLIERTRLLRVANASRRSGLRQRTALAVLRGWLR
jgi:hypothetical protein